MVSQSDNNNCFKHNDSKDIKKYTRYELIFWNITLITLCSGMSYQIYSLIGNYLKYDYDEVTVSATKDPDYFETKHSCEETFMAKLIVEKCGCLSEEMVHQ